MSTVPVFEMAFAGDVVFLIVDGVKIAKRQDETWVSLEPGWRVLEGKLTLADAAASWGVSEADVRKAIKSGKAQAKRDKHGVLRVSSLTIERATVRVH